MSACLSLAALWRSRERFAPFRLFARFFSFFCSLAFFRGGDFFFLLLDRLLALEEEEEAAATDDEDEEEGAGDGEGALEELLLELGAGRRPIGRL